MRKTLLVLPALGIVAFAPATTWALLRLLFVALILAAIVILLAGFATGTYEAIRDALRGSSAQP